MGLVDDLKKRAELVKTLLEEFAKMLPGQRGGFRKYRTVFVPRPA